jgi:hypothetical protein
MCVQKVVNHGDTSCSILALGCSVEGYAEVWVCSPSHQVVEQLYVSPCSDTIEVLQRVILMVMESAIEATVSPVLICAINVRAMVEQPKEAFPIMRKVSGSYISRLKPTKLLGPLTGEVCAPLL